MRRVHLGVALDVEDDGPGWDLCGLRTHADILNETWEWVLSTDLTSTLPRMAPSEDTRTHR